MEPKITHYLLHEIKVTSLFPYNEAVKSTLFQFKACADIELAPVFLSYQLPLLKLMYRDYVLVPAPSFIEKYEKRGFNHVVEMFRPLGLPFYDCLIKTKDVKQANLNYADRQKIGKALAIKEATNLRGKKVLFVDDLLTTGATAYASVRLIRRAGSEDVRILTMGHTPRNNNRQS